MSQEIDPNDPSQVSHAYSEMSPKWHKIRTLLAGTDAMRAAGESYLPVHSDEDQDRYDERLAASTLLNMTEITLNGWVGRPFSDPVQLSEDMPEEVKLLLDDIDLMGNNIDVFARNWFREGVSKGYSHVLVDFPRKEELLDEFGNPIARSLQDDKNEGLRPYWVHIKPENLLFAHSEMKNGKEFLTQVRILEEISTMIGFAEVTTQQIRVITPGFQEIYKPEKQPNGKVEWVLVDGFPYDLDFIPLVTFYADKEGFMVAKPPLIDLADLNIAHWQSTSDQRSILTVSRFPVMALSGGSDDDKLTIGPYNWLYSPDPQSKFYYVEHTGKAIASGRQDLLDLEEQMSNYGSQFLKRRPGNQAATVRALDSAEASSPLQDVIVRFVDAVNQALVLTAAWLNIEHAGEVIISTDFGPEEIEAADLKTLAETRKNRDISRKAYLTELMRRGLLDDEFDIDADKELLEEEAAQLPELDIDEGAGADKETEEEEEGEEKEAGENA